MTPHLTPSPGVGAKKEVREGRRGVDTPAVVAGMMWGAVAMWELRGSKLTSHERAAGWTALV